MKIMVLAANGMIGSAMLRVLSEKPAWDVVGTVRSEMARIQLPTALAGRVMAGIDLTSADVLPRLFHGVRPDVVLNCAGLTKHLPGGNDPLSALAMNAMLPHRLAELCCLAGARLIHVSTDCVFSGSKGNYSEDDPADATDIYGKSKHLGEAAGSNHLTLRTSTIGRELSTRHGLLEWFLSQTECKGYCRAIFSGLPTVEFARIIRDHVIPNERLSGLYHVGAQPIDKDSLLRLIAKAYGTNTMIVPDDQVCIDRSLNIERFTAATGYRAPDWIDLIEIMRANQ